MKKKINKLTKKYQLKLLRRERNKKDEEWRKLVKERDNSRCVICGDMKLVHIHHIIPREQQNTRHNILNGISLCAKHHKYSFEISAHRNSFAFYLWLMINRDFQFEYLKRHYLDYKGGIIYK